MTLRGGHFLAVDPGIRGCGVAWFEGSALVRACYVSNLSDQAAGPACAAEMAKEVVATFAGPMRVDFVVVEFPQVYTQGKRKGDPNDLLPLAAVAGALAVLFPVVHVSPREWKGTIDPDVVIERVRGRLTKLETARVQLPAESLQHNVWDAVGIGLHRCGRLAPRRVYPR